MLVAGLSAWFLARLDEAGDRDPGLALVSPPVLEAGEDLDRRIAATLRRSGVLRGIARAVVEGRLTLAEAAERFREVNESTPDFNRRTFRKAFPGASDEERYARWVIALAEGQCRGDGCRAREVAALLKAELGEGLRRGTFRPGE